MNLILTELIKEAKHQWPQLFSFIDSIKRFLEPDILSEGYAKLIIRRGHKSKIRVRVTKEY